MRRLTICFAVLLFCADTAVLAQKRPTRYQVSLPHISLDSGRGERIDAVELAMDCGRFVAINSIPNDWSASVVSPVSEKTSLSMEAGHGSSALWHSEDLNSFVTVSFVDGSCFDIRASVTAAYYEGNDRKQRTVSFTRNKLILTKQVQPPVLTR